jgi:hypothetical protein
MYYFSIYLISVDMNLAKASIIFKFQILQLKQEAIDEEKMGGLSAYT